MDARTHDAYVERAMWQIGKGGLRFWGSVTVLGSLVLFGLYAYLNQLRDGLGVTGLNQKVSWGFYIINCIFFIGMSYGGAMTSAILRLTGAKWRAPLTRLAEATAVAALLVGAVYPIIDLGRPDRIINLFLYPQVGSPIIWDVVAITTYMIASLVFLYLPLIPDVALVRDTLGTTAGRVRRQLYRVLALGWTGSEGQERALRRGVGIMALLIIPLAVSVHSVLAWLFAVTARGGWHSTIFAPIFVLAAMLSGVAAVILVVAALRAAYGLGRFITEKHFRYLSYLLIALGLGYVYFMISEYLTEGYIAEETSGAVLEALFVGQYAPTFWLFAIVGLLFPLVLVAIPGRLPIWRACVASALIVAGMWLKRFLIVVPGMADPIMPWDWGRYTPTWVEIAITVGSAAAIPLMLIVFFRFFPVMSVHEMEEVEEHDLPRAALVPAFGGGDD